MTNFAIDRDRDDRAKGKFKKKTFFTSIPIGGDRQSKFCEHRIHIHFEPRVWHTSPIIWSGRESGRRKNPLYHGIAPRNVSTLWFRTTRTTPPTRLYRFIIVTITTMYGKRTMARRVRQQRSDRKSPTRYYRVHTGCFRSNRKHLSRARRPRGPCRYGRHKRVV